MRTEGVGMFPVQPGLRCCLSWSPIHRGKVSPVVVWWEHTAPISRSGPWAPQPPGLSRFGQFTIAAVTKHEIPVSCLASAAWRRTHNYWFHAGICQPLSFSWCVWWACLEGLGLNEACWSSLSRFSSQKNSDKLCEMYKTDVSQWGENNRSTGEWQWGVRWRREDGISAYERWSTHSESKVKREKSGEEVHSIFWVSFSQWKCSFKHDSRD